MFTARTLAPTGALRARITRAPRAATVWAAFVAGLPRPGLPAEVFRYRVRNLPNLWRGTWKLLLAQLIKAPHFYGVVSARLRRANGEVLDFGVVSLRVVTTAGVNFIVDAFQNITEVENLKFHGVGTGGTAEAAGDTALVTESTTILNPDSTRATGTTVEGASANIYRTVGTVTFDGSGAITEHGIFSQAATGGGTLLDRSLFAAINVVSADSIAFTYELTLTAGS